VKRRTRTKEALERGGGTRTLGTECGNARTIGRPIGIHICLFDVAIVGDTGRGEVLGQCAIRRGDIAHRQSIKVDQLDTRDVADSEPEVEITGLVVKPGDLRRTVK
jgi:hypothetical protein